MSEALPDPLFVTFEGPDGSGKTTQASRLAERLRELGRAVVLTREPGGGGPVAESVRNLLLHGAEMAPETELLLFFAARAEHVASLIRPALAAGKIVICDRYTDSSLAYQGAGLGVDPALIRALHAIATGDLWPDVTILIDLPPEDGLARQADRNRMEERGLEFATRVRNGFLRLAEAEPNRYRVVDARGSVGQVADRVWRAFSGMPK
ncbi:MAG TPA: dTMP kinase [Armatimonadota bacterium]|jgi:dTMP kinase